jgi:hypothetical protein
VYFCVAREVRASDKQPVRFRMLCRLDLVERGVDFVAAALRVCAAVVDASQGPT